MRIAVIGGVAAGLSAAARARRLDPSADIIVLEKGSTISYAACGLPYYIEGTVRDWQELVRYTPDYFRKERNIEVRTQAEVASIHHSRRELRLVGGDRLSYDRLVIATGARPALEGIRGADLPNVFTLHTLDSGRRLKEGIARHNRGSAVVVGGGYIGLEVVEALRSNGYAVTLFHDGGDLLGRRDPELSSLVKAHLERFRVRCRFFEQVTEIERGAVRGVPCDLVVLCPGIRPNVEIAAEAGVEIGRTGAIRVDERMETNLAGVFAAGDCAETTHLVSGKPVYIPLGTTANKMGRVAGASAAGSRSERFPGIVGTSIVRVCGLAAASTGLSLHQARQEGFDAVSARIRDRDRPRYFRGRPIHVELVADRRSGRLLGGSVVGEHGVEGRVNVIAAALQSRMPVEEFEGLDLAYAPPFAPVWDPLLIAAQQLLKIL